MRLDVPLHPYSRLGHMESLEGAKILERKLDVASNNMVNVDTVGFKQERTTFDEYLLPQLDGTNRTAKGEVAYTDFSQGVTRETGNPYDFAIEGDGFFAVETPEGTRYTRAGNFMLDAQNQLVTQEGYPVLGGGAPIVLEDTTGKGVWLSDDGYFYVDETQTVHLDVVTFDNPQALRRTGGNFFMATDDSGPEMPAEDTRVSQGFIEGSNVNPLESMVQIMTIYRNYEAQQKAMQLVDQMDGRATNDVGRPL